MYVEVEFATETSVQTQLRCIETLQQSRARDGDPQGWRRRPSRYRIRSAGQQATADGDEWEGTEKFVDGLNTSMVVAVDKVIWC